MDLIGADLKFVRLFDAVLGNVDLLKVRICTNAVLIGAKLKSAKLTGAKLTERESEICKADRCELGRRSPDSARNLSGADLEGGKGLTQKQLDHDGGA